ncbi:hypothetical protein HMPREF1155_0964 [Slackia sp. CM382]|nr:hypothetical protein HMPREF1155_0964 [Slackia sp. CM382]
MPQRSRRSTARSEAGKVFDGSFGESGRKGSRLGQDRAQRRWGSQQCVGRFHLLQ